MAQETVGFVRKLAHNDDSIRKKTFKSLVTFLQSKDGGKFSQSDNEKLWKGLYFSMWYCDKPIPQQSLAGDLGKLFSEYVPQENLTSFHRSFWIIILREWLTLDKWRLDKFLMLVRRVLRNMLFRLEKNGWKNEEIDEFLLVIEEFPLMNNSKFPQSLAYHFCDIFLDEIEYVIFQTLRDYSEEEQVDDDEDEDEEEDEEQNEEDDEEENQDDEKADDLKLPTSEGKELKKAEILEKTPLKKLIEPFEKLAEVAKNKAMRTKIKEEILNDDRLIAWGLVKSEESDEEDEWTGF